MARQARIKNEFGLFHIHQIGGQDRKLFEGDADRSAFLNILKRAQAQFDFRLYAYCLLSDNDFHLVIDVNGSDLSKIMKSINIGYAMYAKCPGRLFKDRYKSQLLANENEMIDHVEHLHRNAKDSSPWNSFCLYDPRTPLKLDWVTPLHVEHEFNLQECALPTKDIATCTDCIKTLDDAQIKLERLASEAHQTVQELIRDKSCRNRLIHDFRKGSTLSLKELGVLFGGLSESSICKILGRDNPG